ncbi:MAG: sugar phosphate isomerase/epimerase family protein [Liquorilactobacillus ghanensis]|uniref:sugar phosphate isomerase/epimerase family protein n=1 Tax=Liquorilactobacillus ghanensis TaxID=399370 RepID=UPI0039EBBCDC
MIKTDNLAGMNIHYPFYALEDFFSYQNNIGIKNVELWGGTPHLYLDAASFESLNKVIALARKYKIKIPVFTPESIIYQYNIAAPNKEQWQKSKLYFKNAIRITAELGAKIMGINSGFGLLNEPASEAWQRSLEMLSSLSEFAAQQNVTLALETLRPEESQIVTTIEDAKKMLHEVNSDFLKPMIDTTAITVAGETLEQWFNTFGTSIVHIHFVDCGKKGGHLAWRDGEQDLAAAIKTLNKYNYTGFLGQEITASRYYKKPFEADKRVFQLIKNQTEK